MPLVSGMRSGTLSAASSGAGPTDFDGGISSAGSEYRGLPKISLFARVSKRVMPMVVNSVASADCSRACV